MADGTGTTTYSYDSRDRLTGQTNGAGAAVGYGYDAASNLTRIGYPTAGQSVSRGYDAVNRLTSVKDWLGHSTSFGYDDNANLTGVTYPTTNKVAAVYSHDTANGLSKIVDSRTTGGTTAPFWSYTYTLDSLEQVGAVNDPVQPGAVQHTYARNTLDQLTGDARGGTGTGSTGWGYDSAYRIATRTDSGAGHRGHLHAGQRRRADRPGDQDRRAFTQNLTLSYNRDVNKREIMAKNRREK